MKFEQIKRRANDYLQEQMRQNPNEWLRLMAALGPEEMANN